MTMSIQTDTPGFNNVLITMSGTVQTITYKVNKFLYSMSVLQSLTEVDDRSIINVIQKEVSQMTIHTERHILEKGAELIRRNGFNNTGLSTILKVAGVPKGSFYYYFKNKEDFGLRLIEYLHDSIKPVFYGFLTGECESPPLERLREFFAYFRRIFTNEKVMSGCPIGNISQEMAASNPRFREKLADVFTDITNPVVICLQHAQEQGSLTQEEDVVSLAKFIVNSWQGALIALKITGTAESLIIFEKFVFDVLLRSRTPAVQDPETKRNNPMSWQLSHITP